MICHWPVAFIENDKKYSISRYKTSYGVNVHAHVYYEMEYVLSGSYHQNVKDESYECSRGCMSLFNPDSRHRFDTSNEVEVFRIQIKPTSLPKIFKEHADEFGPVSIINIPPNEIRRIENILFMIEKEFNDQNDLFSDVIEGCLEVLFALLIRINRSTLESSKVATIDVRTILTYIDNNLKTVTPSSVAAFSGYNFPYFSKLFKKNIGQNLSEYINLRKLETAQKMLVETTKSIENIGYEVGFNHKSYFHRVFKRYYGVTPEEYRIANGGNEKRRK